MTNKCRCGQPALFSRSFCSAKCRRTYQDAYRKAYLKTDKYKAYKKAYQKKKVIKNDNLHERQRTPL